MPEPEASRARVAVVVPCFNDGATLPETLASLASQEAAEVVVVDDGSDDPATLAVLDEVERSGTRVLHRENSGQSAARMAGVGATSAPYVLAVDADDQLAPGALTALADALDVHPAAGIAWGDTESFGEATMHVRKARSLDPWAITYVNELPTASLVRRDALLAAGGWQLREGYEDWDLWMGLAERGWQGVHVDRITLRYRLHGARSWASHFERHDTIVSQLHARHPALFAARRANWRRSSAPWRLKLLLPVVERLPLSQATTYRIVNFLAAPGILLKLRLSRLVRRRSVRILS
jgi:glycosyltransferase involved in cell wall biosynthesis